MDNETLASLLRGRNRAGQPVDATANIIGPAISALGNTIYGAGRGALTAMAGLPGDINQLITDNLGTLVNAQGLPTTKDIQDFLPLKPTTYEGKLAQKLGEFVPVNPTPIAKGAVAIAKPVGKAMGEQAYRMTEDMLQKQGMMPSIVAYHGTPHNIEGAFDISKVGTGEGAQAYGHGMYYAENPDVAKSYATDRSYVGKFMAGTPDNTTWDAKRIAQDTLNVYGDNAITELQNTLKANSQLKNPKQLEANKELEDAIDILKTNQLKPLGNLYKVDIPDEYVPKMLQWDKPLNQQPDLLENIKKLGEREDLPKGFAKALEKALESKHFDGQDLYYELTKVYKDPSMLSKAMEESGFKGIKYLDQGSRGKEKGSSNFVVFDPKEVKILEKNSKPVSRKDILEKELNKVEIFNPNMSIDEFKSLAEKGQMRQARTFDQDVKDVINKKMPANIFELTGKNAYDYESGNFVKKLEKAGLYVDDDKLGTVIAGKTKKDVERLKQAQTPIEHGLSYGYKPEDIAKFYVNRRGNRADIGYAEFLDDLKQFNKKN